MNKLSSELQFYREFKEITFGFTVSLFSDIEAHFKRLIHVAILFAVWLFIILLISRINTILNQPTAVA